LEEDSFYKVQVEYTSKKTLIDDLEAQALIRSVKTTFEKYVKLNKTHSSPEILMRVSSIDSCG
jgi:ATP-dependent Lon protease